MIRRLMDPQLSSGLKAATNLRSGLNTHEKQLPLLAGTQLKSADWRRRRLTGSE